MSSITDYIEPIGTFNGEEFEYLQYNDDLRIVHNITRNTFRANDIIACLGSVKKIDVWQSSVGTMELITELITFRKSPKLGTYEMRPSSIEECIYTMDNGKEYNMLPGVYVHKILINSVAMWASPRYAYKIMNFLNKYYDEQREEKIRELTEEKDTLLSKVNKLLRDNKKQSKQNKDQSKKMDEQTRKIDELLTINNNQTKKIDDQTKKIDSQTVLIKSTKATLENVSETIDCIRDTTEGLRNRITPDSLYTIRLEIENFKEGANTCRIISKCMETKLLNKSKFRNVSKKNKQIYIKNDASCAIEGFKTTRDMIASNYALPGTYKCRKWDMNTDNLENMLIDFSEMIENMNEPVDDMLEEIDELDDDVIDLKEDLD